jgi:hypothetical protein
MVNAGREGWTRTTTMWMELVPTSIAARIRSCSAAIRGTLNSLSLILRTELTISINPLKKSLPEKQRTGTQKEASGKEAKYIESPLMQIWYHF